jgi:hypothetical protein
LLHCSVRICNAVTQRASAMFVCYVCSKCEDSIIAFRAHLQRHSVTGELRLPLICVECKSSFAKIYTLVRHVDAFHKDSKFVGSATALACNDSGTNDELSEVNLIDSDSDTEPVESSTDLADAVRNEGIALVAGLRANSSIPFMVIPTVVDSINQISASLTSLYQQKTISCLESAGIDKNVISSIKGQLNSSRELAARPLEFLETRYKQDKFFNSHSLAVVPETVSFGLEIASHGGSSQIISESFQYVSVEKTLRTLLQSEDYVRLLLHDKCCQGVIEDYADGEQYKQPPLFSDSSKCSIMIQLFYDGLGVTNPLRGQSTLHNIGVFFTPYVTCRSNIIVVLRMCTY